MLESFVITYLKIEIENKREGTHVATCLVKLLCVTKYLLK